MLPRFERRMRVFTKKSLVWLLVVTLLPVASNAQAEAFRFPVDAAEAATSNQTYVAAEAGNPMGDWEVATVPSAPGGNDRNWWSAGTDVGQGTSGMSSDTPDASNWSVFADSGAWDDGGAYDYSTYVYGYTIQTGFPAGNYTVSYDAKGDLYTYLDVQNGSLDVGHSILAQTTAWNHYEANVTVAAGGVDGFSFYLYDNSGGDDSGGVGGQGAWMDNLSLIVAPPDPDPLTPYNLFSTGDVEDGGNSTTPPLYWSQNGNDAGQGTIGVSTDTPTGTGQSLRVEGWDDPGYDYWTYSHDYSDQSGHPAGDYHLSYDYKGDVYTVLGVQNGAFAPEGGHTEWYDSTSAWTHVEDTITVDAGGVNGFSFHLYDRSATGNAAYLDNLVLVPVIPGDFDHNGVADGNDFLLWQRGGSPNPFSQTDLDDWQANYGPPAIAAAAAAVPEPASVGLLVGAMGMLVLVGRRSHVD
jgi:hypothetical protein